MTLAAIKDILPGITTPGEFFYRMANENYASTIDDIGPSFIYGGRYNPANEFGVLYLSISKDCAYLERLRHVQGRKDNLLPQATADFTVKIRKCLNLLDLDVLRAIGISQEDLVRHNDFSVPQNISREARNAGFEALLTPSAAEEKCKSLVVFKDKLSPPSHCTLKPRSIKAYKK